MKGPNRSRARRPRDPVRSDADTSGANAVDVLWRRGNPVSRLPRTKQRSWLGSWCRRAYRAPSWPTSRTAPALASLFLSDARPHPAVDENSYRYPSRDDYRDGEEFRQGSAVQRTSDGPSNRCQDTRAPRSGHGFQIHHWVSPFVSPPNGSNHVARHIRRLQGGPVFSESLQCHRPVRSPWREACRALLFSSERRIGQRAPCPLWHTICLAADGHQGRSP
jgi:hypothetical protein